MPDEYKNNNFCEATCGKWKPMRVHHCRQCGICSLRMDHHCPWTVNCIGAKNHKSFYLFCVYSWVINKISLKIRVFYYILYINRWDVPIIATEQYISISLNPRKERFGITAAFFMFFGLLIQWLFCL